VFRRGEGSLTTCGPGLHGRSVHRGDRMTRGVQAPPTPPGPLFGRGSWRPRGRCGRNLEGNRPSPRFNEPSSLGKRLRMKAVVSLLGPQASRKRIGRNRWVLRSRERNGFRQLFGSPICSTGFRVVPTSRDWVSSLTWNGSSATSATRRPSPRSATPSIHCG